MIPKKVHYIWLGRNKKDRASQICINSWKKNLTDYEIIEWNEDNLPLNDIASENLFFSYCMKYKLWAFMSDYLRLWILEREGGIYLDTDVQVIKKFDDLLHFPMFLGYEMDNYIGTGIIASEKGNPIIKALLDFYSNRIWEVDYYNNPIIFSNIIGDNPNYCDNCKILPKEYLSPYNPNIDYKTNSVEQTETYTSHWFNANWGMNRRGYVFLNTKQYKGLRKIKEYIRKNIGYFLRKKGFKKF